MTIGLDFPCVPAVAGFANATLVGSATAATRTTIAFFILFSPIRRPTVPRILFEACQLRGSDSVAPCKAGRRYEGAAGDEAGRRSRGMATRPITSVGRTITPR